MTFLNVNPLTFETSVIACCDVDNPLNLPQHQIPKRISKYQNNPAPFKSHQTLGKRIKSYANAIELIAAAAVTKIKLKHVDLFSLD